MSIIHTITPKKELDVDALCKYASRIPRTRYEFRGKDVVYFYAIRKSTRGFDITLHDNRIEVRNTALSNKYDYHLTNKVVSKIIELTTGYLEDEEGNEVNQLPLFSKKFMKDRLLEDCKTLRILAKDAGDIAIHGPKRKVHFAEQAYKVLEPYSDKELVKYVPGLIQYVNFGIPDYSYGDVLELEDSEGEKRIWKQLTNLSPCIVDKYDRILLAREGQNPMMITNRILNKIRPKQWERVDEYTIVAPQISQQEWALLLARALPHDMWDEEVTQSE